MTQRTDLPDLTTIDFSDAAQIERVAGIIVAQASDTGLLAGRGRRNSRVVAAACEWLTRVDERIDTLTPGYALVAACHYDLLHRIATGRPADRRILDLYCLKAFEAYVKGDRSVDQYRLHQVVMQEVSRGNAAYLDRPLQWATTCIAGWHKQFATGVSPQPLSDYDTVQRVTILLRSDLWAFETRNEAAYKHRLLTAHRHLLEHISAFSHQ